jgi:hypothetical protein
MACSCGLKVGNDVDWWAWSERLGRPYKTQRRRWHGVITADHGSKGSPRSSRTDLHWLEVSWTESTNWKPFKDSMTGRMVVPKPGYRELVPCRELVACGTNLHP